MPIVSLNSGVVRRRNQMGEEATLPPAEWQELWNLYFALSKEQNSAVVTLKYLGVEKKGTWLELEAFYTNLYNQQHDRVNLEARALETSTEGLKAQRTSAKVGLDTYGNLLKNYGTKLSADEKEFLKYFFLTQPTEKDPKNLEADTKRVTEILTRLNYKQETSKSFPLLWAGVGVLFLMLRK